MIVPARRFGDYLATMCGLIRRYGCGEPTLDLALLRLLGNALTAVGEDPDRIAAIEREVVLIMADAERTTVQPADLVPVRMVVDQLMAELARRR